MNRGGGDAGNHLARLLDLKDTAHYGVIPVSGRAVTAALRQVGALITFAETVVQRNRSHG